MHAPMAAAWSGLSTPGAWDLTPLLYGALLLLAVRFGGIRIRWWGILVAAAAGLPCSTLAAHFGPWAALLVAAMVFAGSAPIARARRRGEGV